jgi:hypothetical protein
VAAGSGGGSLPPHPALRMHHWCCRARLLGLGACQRRPVRSCWRQHAPKLRAASSIEHRRADCRQKQCPGVEVHKRSNGGLLSSSDFASAQSAAELRTTQSEALARNFSSGLCCPCWNDHVLRLPPTPRCPRGLELLPTVAPRTWDPCL